MGGGLRGTGRKSLENPFPGLTQAKSLGFGDRLQRFKSQLYRLLGCDAGQILSGPQFSHLCNEDDNNRAHPKDHRED